MDTDAAVLAALIAAVPATIGALAAWRTHQQVKPNGGNTESLSDRFDRFVSYQHQTNQHLFNSIAVVARVQGIDLLPTPPPDEGLIR